MPIIGTIASSRRTGGVVELAYDSLQKVTVGSDTAYIEFTSIPSTYKHLQIRQTVKGSRSDSSVGNALFVYFNDDLGANYNYQYAYGAGNSTGGSGGSASDANSYWYIATSSNAAANSMFGPAVVNILDYASTSKNKMLNSFAGFSTNGSPGENFFISACQWLNTSAITKIRITGGGFDILAGSEFALYGLKG